MGEGVPQRRVLALSVLALIGGLLGGVGASVAQEVAQPDEAPTGWRERASQAAIACREQEPQDALIRANWITKRWMTRDEIRARRQVHQRAIRYRTETYGRFGGFGEAAWNPRAPMEQARGLRLFDRRVRLHEKVIPAARCAEQWIARSCEDDYQPRRLSGIRDRNTYHNGEVSNHVFGIAIDLDPRENTCCNCVKEWRLHPLCQATPRSIFDRMVMPECWVQGFERYGFYWLGHDSLMDTMHFEFLGQPEMIRSDGAGAESAE